MLSDSSYKLTMTEWENILYQNPGESAFKVAVAAYQNETPLTGPYISNVLLMSKPYVETIVRTINYTPSTRYIEDKVTLRPGQCVEYYITCNVQTRLLMQTFGNKDTKMYLYDSNDVLLNESDDEGYTINSLIIRFFEC